MPQGCFQGCAPERPALKCRLFHLFVHQYGKYFEVSTLGSVILLSRLKSISCKGPAVDFAKP
jgi:hypothetical protein